MANNFSDENKLVKCLLTLYKTKYSSNRTVNDFLVFHNLFQDYVIEEAWKSNDEIELYNLLPKCNGVKTYYCEARIIKQIKEDLSEEMMILCPRTKNRYNLKDNDCFHVYPENKMSWEEWSFIELLSDLNLKPSLTGIEHPDAYVNGLSGWVNRLNEIRIRIKCKLCKSVMTAEEEYAKYLAVYRRTVFQCHNCNNEKVYISHCWACDNIIDSRYDEIRDPDPHTYYICLKCGSGKRNSALFTQGDRCPKCGTKHMQLINNSIKMKCLNCSHTINLPTPIEKKLTGPNAAKLLSRIRNK